MSIWIWGPSDYGNQKVMNLGQKKYYNITYVHLSIKLVFFFTSLVHIPESVRIYQDESQNGVI